MDECITFFYDKINSLIAKYAPLRKRRYYAFPRWFDEYTKQKTCPFKRTAF